jgi:hypothetical protein
MQTTVFAQMGFGVPGELFDSGPVRAQPYNLVSASASYNVFGSAFTFLSQGTAQAGNPGGSAVFVGILVNPKGSASAGTSGAPLAPTLTLPNNAPAELLTEGSIIVSLPAAANVGDLVVFDNTTGALSTIAPTAEIPSGKSPAFAFVDRFPITAASLAVITLQPSLAYVPAS